MDRKQVDAELASRLESLGQGVGAALDHILDIVRDRINKIEETAPRTVLVQSKPRDWICSVCGTGMLSNHTNVFVHVCKNDGVYDGEEV